MIAIIDYGVGNLRSVEKAFAAVDVDARISSDKEFLSNARALVLPGVGAFGDAIATLRAGGYDQLLKEAVDAGKPLLGVCLGYQLLFEESEEFGVHKGLGLLPGRVVRFPANDLHVPHVGWNQIKQHRQHLLFDGIADDAYFYFVHSYYVEPAKAELPLGLTDYGITFSSMAAQENVMGVQFHPEKSQQCGLQLLKNFARF